MNVELSTQPVRLDFGGVRGLPWFSCATRTPDAMAPFIEADAVCSPDCVADARALAAATLATIVCKKILRSITRFLPSRA